LPLPAETGASIVRSSTAGCGWEKPHIGCMKACHYAPEGGQRQRCPPSGALLSPGLLLSPLEHHESVAGAWLRGELLWPFLACFGSGVGDCVTLDLVDAQDRLALFGAAGVQDVDFPGLLAQDDRVPALRGVVTHPEGPVGAFLDHPHLLQLLGRLPLAVAL